MVYHVVVGGAFSEKLYVGLLNDSLLECGGEMGDWSSASAILGGPVVGSCESLCGGSWGGAGDSSGGLVLDRFLACSLGDSLFGVCDRRCLSLTPGDLSISMVSLAGLSGVCIGSWWCAVSGVDGCSVVVSC